MLGLRLMISVLACLAMAVVGAGPALADPQPLASVPAVTPLSAARGWVVWSAPDGKAWRLMAWHDGAVRALPVAPRPAPFDADVGTDRRGRPVVTFSRCVRTPERLGGYNAPMAGTTGRGCSVRVLELAGGRERSAGVSRVAGDSDTTPSMWRGALAFARRTPAHRDVEQILLRPAGARRLVRLPHGDVPTDCPFRDGCAGMPVVGDVTELDLGARRLAFRWWVDAPGVVGHGGWELRVDDLASRRGRLLISGFAGEACTGAPIDGTAPGAPSLDGAAVWWLQVSSACDHQLADLRRGDAGTGALATASLPPTVIGLAADGDALYALQAPPPAPPATGSSQPAETTCAPAAPCTLERISTPAVAPLSGRPSPPFF